MTETERPGVELEMTRLELARLLRALWRADGEGLVPHLPTTAGFIEALTRWVAGTHHGDIPPFDQFDAKLVEQELTGFDQQKIASLGLDPEPAGFVLDVTMTAIYADREELQRIREQAEPQPSSPADMEYCRAAAQTLGILLSSAFYMNDVDAAVTVGGDTVMAVDADALWREVRVALTGRLRDAVALGESCKTILNSGEGLAVNDRKQIVLQLTVTVSDDLTAEGVRDVLQPIFDEALQEGVAWLGDAEIGRLELAETDETVAKTAVLDLAREFDLRSASCRHTATKLAHHLRFSEADSAKARGEAYQLCDIELRALARAPHGGKSLAERSMRAPELNALRVVEAALRWFECDLPVFVQTSDGDEVTEVDGKDDSPVLELHLKEGRDGPLAESLIDADALAIRNVLNNLSLVLGLARRGAGVDDARDL